MQTKWDIVHCTAGSKNAIFDLLRIVRYQVAFNENQNSVNASLTYAQLGYR
jgi:hypothetical protein